MSLKNKIALLSVFIAFSFLAISMIGLQVLKSASEKDNFARIEQLFKSAYSTISELEKLEQTRQLTEQQAKRLATQLLRENKYHPSEYVYVTDDQLNFIAAPHDPQLHGTSFNDFKDAEGNSIGEIVAQVTAQQPGNMVTYDWTSERDGEVVGLKSVAQKSNVWGWYIGTGISFKETDERYWSTAQWLLVASVLLIVVITLIIYKFGQNLSSSLGGEVKDVVAIVAKVSTGDLSQASTEHGYDRQSVMGSLSYMKHALKDVVQEILVVSNTLSSQVQESEQQSSELERFVNSLDKDTFAASQSITEVANGLKLTTEEINTSAVNLAEAEVRGTQANDMTQKSSAAIGELETNIQSAGKSVQQLASEVQQIENVLTVIQGVAEQTNLLALNAAIEAARAGEQGRGFAVVADEVRQLAHRTQKSTQEIQTMIERLQQAAQNALTSVNSSVDKSAVVVSRSEEASKAIDDLLTIVSSVAGTSQSILAASQQQLSETDVVSQRLSTISKMAQETNHVAKHAQESSKLILDCSSSLQTETEKFVI